MITLSAKIKVSNNNKNTAISGLDTNHSAVYYASTIAEVLNKSVDEPTPFVLGSTALGSGAAFGKGKVGFYIGDEKSDVNGVFEDAYALYFQGTNLSQAQFLRARTALNLTRRKRNMPSALNYTQVWAKLGLRSG